jgi:hypothetical protein
MSLSIGWDPLVGPRQPRRAALLAGGAGCLVGGATLGQIARGFASQHAFLRSLLFERPHFAQDLDRFGLRLGKFKQVAEQRKRIVARIKELQPKVSNRQIARTLGVRETTVRRDTAPNGAPDFTGERAAKLVMRRETASADRIAKVAADEASRPSAASARPGTAARRWPRAWVPARVRPGRGA